MADGNETVTVIRRPPRDYRTGDQPTSPATRFAMPGCLFAPGSSGEVNFEEQQVRVDAQLYAPPGNGDGTTTLAGADILPTDQIQRGNGDVYDVAGKPADWGDSGVVINLKLQIG